MTEPDDLGERIEAAFPDARRATFTLKGFSFVRPSREPEPVWSPEPMPPPVDDHREHWGEPPAALSARCMWWIEYLSNERSSERLCELMPMEGYDGDSEELGVWIWEWCNVLYPVWRYRIDTRLSMDLLPARERALSGGPTCLESHTTKCIREPGHEPPHADLGAQRW